MSRKVKVVRVGNNLDIDDDGGLEFDINPNGESIEWFLHGTGLNGCRFPDEWDAHEPFTWIGSPKAGVFTGLAAISQGRSLTLDVNHLSKNSAGRFVYMLRVKGPGEDLYYSSTFDLGPKTKDGRTINNPIIINKGEKVRSTKKKKPGEE